MDDAKLTVRDLVLEPGHVSVSSEVARIAADRDVGGEVAKVVARMATAGKDYLAGEVGEVADGLLDLDVTDVIAHSWDRHRAIGEAKEWSAKNPDGEMVVPLVTHTVKWSYEPSVEVKVDEVPITSVALAVALDTTVKGAVIAFRRGEVADVRTGTVEVRAKVECEGVKLAERTGSFDLPGLLGFSGAPRVVAPSEPDPAPAVPPVPAGPASRYRPGEIVNGHRLNADATAWEPVGRYRPGDIVNGHRLNSDATAWEPIGS
ncbi:hypothetical protein [Agromyces binzhouensis]|uniref:Uncharacterized protein n=1 Tax=Agromyces binzhouensis TaxID=1817495 RepID=A0A4Q2JJV3_9MICO|nr:hypothetical protein [Agromyces binzhouensis]RXZ48385.1 hypothetical protein ESO86_06735 [Agromyces binzhouensis]